MRYTLNVRARWLLGASTALMVAAGAAWADGKIDDKAASVLAAAKSASGGAAWDNIGGMQATATVAMGGLTGPAHSLIDTENGHYTDDFVLGPMSGREGFDGNMAWSVDPSGQPRVEGGGEAVLSAVNQAYRDSLAYWYPARHDATITWQGQKQDDGVTYDIVRIVPRNGRKFDFWIDAKTHLITRMAEQTESDLHTEFYSDFRTVSGTQMPFATRVSIGDPKYDQILTMSTITAVPSADAARFAIPAPPPPDFAFPHGVSRVSLPIQLWNNHIYLPVTIEGHAYPFVFDTGATNVIGKQWEGRMGVTDQGKLPGGGVGDAKADVGLATVSQIDIGGLTLRKQAFATIGEDLWERVEGKPSAGLVGYEVARRVVTVIDYARQRITFIKPEAFTPPAGATPIHITFNDHTPQIEGALDGVPGKFDIDTGSRSTVDIPMPFVASHASLQNYKASPPAITGWGVGGPARSRITYAHTLELGGLTIRHPLIELSAQTKGAFASPYFAGNVGGGVLRRFTVTLDYPHATMYLQENENFADPDVFDRSGMWVIQSADGQGAEVKDVMTGSAAAEAGITTADRIVAVDGKKVADLSLPELRAKFKQKIGTAVKLQVAGPQGTREARLTLRDVM